MKRRTWVILGCAAVVLLIALGCWRLIPRSADRILPDRAEDTVRASFVAIEAGVADGETQNRTWTTDTVRPMEAAYQQVEEILHSTTYCPSMWNLAMLFRPEESYTGGTLRRFSAMYVWGAEADNVAIVVYNHDEQVIAEINGRIYYPEDPTILDRLVQVVQAHEAK